MYRSVNCFLALLVALVTRVFAIYSDTDSTLLMMNWNAPGQWVLLSYFSL